MKSEEILNQMIGFVQEIAAELRGQYVVGYYPRNPGTASTHVIRVRMKSPTYHARYQREVLSASIAGKVECPP
jgi:hypothetical protein